MKVVKLISQPSVYCWKVCALTFGSWKSLQTRRVKRFSFFCWGRKGSKWRPRGNSTAKLSSLGFLQSPPGLLEGLNPPPYKVSHCHGNLPKLTGMSSMGPRARGYHSSEKSRVFGIRLTGVSVLARPGMCHDPGQTSYPLWSTVSSAV